MADGGQGEAWKGVGRAVDDWTRDPHGRGLTLMGKRRGRNPWGVWQGVWGAEVDEEMKRRSGLVVAARGEEETLVDGAAKPWANM